MTAVLLFRNINSSDTQEAKLLSFGFKKDVYTPFTSLTANFIASTTDTSTVSEVMLYINNRLVHHGIIDSITVTRSRGVKTGHLISSSFTCMLRQNQLEPGLYTNISINSLMDSMIAIPYVTHQNSSDTSGYIYVLKGSTMWDGVVNLCYKQTGHHPYIRGTNCIMLDPYSQPESFSYTEGSVIASGEGISTKHLVSDLHMADIDEHYGTFDLHDPDAGVRNIVRHLYFDLDKRFLYDPTQALQFRDKISTRAWKRHFITYSGYRGEDLSDLATFGSLTDRRISAVEITGSREGIFTEISVYDDRFSV